MSKESIDNKNGENALKEYIEKKPERLDNFKKAIGDFSFENFRSICVEDKEFSENFDDIIKYATKYTESLIELEKLHGCANKSEECDREMMELLTRQNEEKQSFIKSLEELNLVMQGKNMKFLESFIGKSPVFYAELALFVAFSELNF